MNLRPVFVLSAAALALAACETTTPAPVALVTPAPASNAVVQFRTSDFAWSTAPGKGAINGRLTYKAKGAAYSCAELGVVLTPETPWVRRRMEILYGSAEKAVVPATEVRSRTPPGSSNDYQAFVKRATCDATGKFVFNGVPDGAWFAITVAKPNPAGVDMAIMQRVIVRDGKAINLTL